MKLGFQLVMGVPQKLDGLCHGKIPSFEMDDWGYPLWRNGNLQKKHIHRMLIWINCHDSPETSGDDSANPDPNTIIFFWTSQGRNHKFIQGKTGWKTVPFKGSTNIPWSPIHIHFFVVSRWNPYEIQMVPSDDFTQLWENDPLMQ